MKIAAIYFSSAKQLKYVGGKLCMENVRELLKTCRSGKEMIEKIWSFKEKEQFKIWVFLWRW